MPARYLQIEIDDLERGLPCRVVDRPDVATRDVLWRAEYEAGFCERKAAETRHFLESEGWACRPLGAQERQADAGYLQGSGSHGRNVVAVWRCREGLLPKSPRVIHARDGRATPPVPSARPDGSVHSGGRGGPNGSAPDLFANAPLRAAVERDLDAIGQNLDDATRVDSALGDLNGDDIDDAVVVLSRRSLDEAPHRMLMAYLKTDEAFNLVDVSILRSVGAGEAELALTIESGAIHLADCCGATEAQTVLVLQERKLSRLEGEPQ